MKSLKFYNPKLSTEEKIIKFSGIISIGVIFLGNHVAGEFSPIILFFYSIPLIIMIALSIYFSTFVAKNKILRNLVILINVIIILFFLASDIYSLGMNPNEEFLKL